MDALGDSAGARLETALEALYEQGVTESDQIPDKGDAELTGYRGHPMQGMAEQLEALLGAEKAAGLAAFIGERLGR